MRDNTKSKNKLNMTTVYNQTTLEATFDALTIREDEPKPLIVNKVKKVKKPVSEHELARRKAYYLLNKDKLKANYEANKEEILAKRAAKSEEISVYFKEWYNRDGNKEHVKQRRIERNNAKKLAKAAAKAAAKATGEE